MFDGDECQGASVGGNAHEIYSSPDTVKLYSDLAEGGELFPQEREAIARCFTRSGASVLDVGCGAGRVAGALHERGFDVTGIDISEPLIEAAREQFPSIDFRVADVTDSGLPDEAFEYAIFSYVGLDLVLPKERRLLALRELYRVLKPGGILVFSSHNSWNLVPSLLLGNFEYVKDLYFTRKNVPRLFSRVKIEHIDEGDVEIYLSNPLRQWWQLHICGFTLLDVIGHVEGVARFLVRDPHYVATK